MRPPTRLTIADQSPDVDVIYVSSRAQSTDAPYLIVPAHSHHYEHVRDALLAGKHVLCEKAMTVNAQQAKALFELALKQKRLLVEGTWTRYFPISQHIQRLLHEEKAIGDILQINAEVRRSPVDRLICAALSCVRSLYAAQRLASHRPGARWRCSARSRVRPVGSILLTAADRTRGSGPYTLAGGFSCCRTSMTSAPVPKITGTSSLDSPLPIPEIKATMRLARHHPDGEVDVRRVSACEPCSTRPRVGLCSRPRAQLTDQDTTSALLRFPDGPICHFDCSLSRRTPSDAAVVVHGSRGQLNVHFVRSLLIACADLISRHFARRSSPSVRGTVPSRTGICARSRIARRRSSIRCLAARMALSTSRCASADMHAMLMGTGRDRALPP